MGDPVFYKVHLREGKLDQRWELYFRIVQQTGPVTFVIWDKMSGRVKRVNANDLKLAKVNGREREKEEKSISCRTRWYWNKKWDWGWQKGNPPLRDPQR